MTHRAGRGRADYGIDAPNIIILGSVGGSAAVILVVFSYLSLRSVQYVFAISLLLLGLLPGLIGLFFAVALLWTSRIGKLRDRDLLINSIQWRGDEKVLDVGCGRGLLLIWAAKRLTTGNAVGIDIWNSNAEFRNTPEMTLNNARIEGVSDRIEVKTADARHLPFEDDSFDVVLSRAMLINIRNRSEKIKAVNEMLRVLKKGGWLGIVIVDVWNTKAYIRAFRENRLTDVKTLERHPFMPPTIIARKPKSDT
jgi:SAM-dependent methyltransferase